MTKKLFFAIFLTTVCCYDFQTEFEQIWRATLEEMRMYSPGPEQKLEHFFCPQGRRGVPGIMGEMGKKELKGCVDLSFVRNEITSYECDVEEAVREIMHKLRSKQIYNDSMPIGMPGFPGYEGRSTSEEIIHQVRTGCYAREQNMTTTNCIATLDIYYDILKTFNNPIQCPHKLYGGIGPRGLRGAPGVEKFIDFEKYLDQICPFKIEN